MCLCLVKLEVYIWPQGTVGDDPVGDQRRGCQDPKVNGVGSLGTVFLKLFRNPVQSIHDGKKAFLEKFSGIIQHDAPAFPFKQRHAKFRFQTVDGLGQGRLCDLQMFCSTGDMLILGGGKKVAKLKQFHDDYLFSEQ